MLVALLIVPLAVINMVGGLDEVWKQIAEINPDLLNAGKLVEYNLTEKLI